MTNALSNPSANAVPSSIGLGGAAQPTPTPAPTSTPPKTTPGPVGGSNPLESMGTSFTRVIKGGTSSIAHDVKTGAEPGAGIRSVKEATETVIGGLAHGVTAGAGIIGIAALGLGALKGPEAIGLIGQNVTKAINIVTTKLAPYRDDPGMAGVSRRIDKPVMPPTMPGSSAEQGGPNR